MTLTRTLRLFTSTTTSTQLASSSTTTELLLLPSSLSTLPSLRLNTLPSLRLSPFRIQLHSLHLFQESQLHDL